MAACNPTGSLGESNAAEHVENWGILKQAEDGDSWRCATCALDHRGCRHLEQGRHVVGTQCVSQAVLRQRLDTFMDEATGKRRLTCESHLAIPLDIKTSPFCDAFTSVFSRHFVYVNNTCCCAATASRMALPS